MSQTLVLAVAQRAFGDDRAANCEAMVEEIAAAIGNGADVVLCPELFEGRYFPQYEEQQYFEWATSLEENPAIEAVCDFAALVPSSLRPTFCMTTGFFAARAASNAAIRPADSRMPSA